MRNYPAGVFSRCVIVFFACLAAFRAEAGDSVVVFNELMYNGTRGDDLEWIELHNQMAVDVEISGWELTGADYVFPAGTIMPGGGYLVVASDPARMGRTNVQGPLESNLANGGERLRLRNHNGRVMDEVDYSDSEPWPAGADGSGFALAKIDPDRGSEDWRNWRVSAESGGTPGVENFGGEAAGAGVVLNEIAAGGLAGFWVEARNDSGEAASLAGYELECAGETDALFLFGEEAVLPVGGFLVIGQEDLGFVPAAGDRVFLYGPGRERLADAAVVGERLRGRSPEHEGRWLAPSEATPGGENVFEIVDSVVINEIMYHPRDLAPMEAVYEGSEIMPMDATWRYEQSGNVPQGWAAAEFDDSSWAAGKGLLYVENSDLPGPKNTALELGRLAYYFRGEFMFSGDPTAAELVLEHIVDDGAVFYLNGREVHRFNMPEGAVEPGTLSITGIGDAARTGPVPISAEFLAEGRNVLAVEVHQTSSGSSDVVFGARLAGRRLVRPARDFTRSTNQWIELYNRSEEAVDLSNWTIGEVERFAFPAGTVLAGGEYLVLARDAAGFAEEYPEATAGGIFEFNLARGSELLTLEDALGNPVDEVFYYDDRPWPWLADGSGASLELRDPRSDNSLPEAWGASSQAGEWRSYSYTAVARPDNGPMRWNEFIFGLLDAGEVLIDDLSVVEDPAGSVRELLQNGSFEGGADGWRFLGTHRRAEVIEDPENPGNRVLHLIADGPAEHMHNHAETTLAGNGQIVNNRRYRVSFRAKWLAGCRKLNTRLYFNRVAATTDLELPERFGTPGRRNSVFEENRGPDLWELAHEPVVPRATEGVTVRVRARDADGVAGVRLWSRADNLGWESRGMEETAPGEFSAALPARGRGTTVQFYIEAEDRAGAVSLYPAAGRESRALYRVMDGQGVSARLHNIRLIMLPEDAARLHEPTEVMSNGRSLCTVVYDEREVFYDTSLHLQASQRGRMSRNRVGFTVRFPADHLFRGVHDSITIDRSGGYSGRGGRQDEIVLRHILNQAGGLPDMYNDLARVITPLSTHTGTAMLLMAKHGGEYWDGIEDGMADGNLHKLELIYYPTTTQGGGPEDLKLPQPDEVTGIELRNLGPEKEAYRWFYLLENHQERDDFRRMMELAQAFSLSGTARAERVAELADASQWARVFAAKTLSGDVDTYAFGLPHNHMFFFPPKGKALTLPWDMDFSWTRGAGESIYPGGQIGELLAQPAYRRLFLGHLKDILDRSYNSGYMRRWTDHYGAMAGQNYSGILSYIGQRASAARSQLPAEAAFRITTNEGQSFTTDQGRVLLEGEAPYTLETLEIAGQPEAVFSWPSAQAWRTEARLQPGANLIRIVGRGFDGSAETNSITVHAVLTELDPDQDGMPSDWEAEHGLNPEVADATRDADGDGFKNLEEYRAGTDPNDPGSRLALGVKASGTELVLSFQAAPGRGYRLQYRTDLELPWRDLLFLPAPDEAGVIEVPQTVSPVAESVFYRLLID